MEEKLQKLLISIQLSARCIFARVCLLWWVLCWQVVTLCRQCVWDCAALSLRVEGGAEGALLDPKDPSLGARIDLPLSVLVVASARRTKREASVIEGGASWTETEASVIEGEVSAIEGEALVSEEEGATPIKLESHPTTKLLPVATGEVDLHTLTATKRAKSRTPLQDQSKNAASNPARNHSEVRQLKSGPPCRYLRLTRIQKSKKSAVGSLQLAPERRTIHKGTNLNLNLVREAAGTAIGALIPAEEALSVPESALEKGETHEATKAVQSPLGLENLLHGAAASSASLVIDSFSRSTFWFRARARSTCSGPS